VALQAVQEKKKEFILPENSNGKVFV